MSETTEAKPATPSTTTYYSPKFFKGSIVRKLIKDSGRRVSVEFLQLLDAHIKHKVEKACSIHNGGKKTLDAATAGQVGIGVE